MWEKMGEGKECDEDTILGSAVWLWEGTRINLNLKSL